MTRRRNRKPTAWFFNMTPLIDVTFLLLTYFMLASHYASAEKPDIALPRPNDSQAQDRPLEEKIIVNVLYQGPTAQPVLMYGPVRAQSLDELKDRLMLAGKANPRTPVVLRADRQVRYRDVRQVMEAISAANLSNLQVIAELQQVQ